VIYIALHEDSFKKNSACKSHLAGEQLLSYGLLYEKGLVYKNEDSAVNAWGKPSLICNPDIFYNISHSEDCTVCIISDKFVVGIDVEMVRDFSMYAANKVCSKEELDRILSKDDPNREFFRYWTLKESYIKFLGMGISYPMKSVTFEIEPDGKVLSNVSGCTFHLIEDLKEFVVALCYGSDAGGK